MPQQPPETPRRANQLLNIMPDKSVSFPIAEGIGIFVGIVAWDLLAEGRLEIIRALIIAAPCSLAWYGVLYWLEQRRNKQRKSV